MPKRSAIDARDFLSQESVSLKNLLTNPPAPKEKVYELYLKEGTFYLIGQDGVERQLSGIHTPASTFLAWGKAGSITAPAWLYNEGISSDITGRLLVHDNLKMQLVTIARTNTDAATIEIYSHEGNLLNASLKVTIDLGSDKVKKVNTYASLDPWTQLAVKLSSGTCSDLLVNILLGSTLI